jgi:hypothetical protein
MTTPKYVSAKHYRYETETHQPNVGPIGRRLRRRHSPAADPFPKKTAQPISALGPRPTACLPTMASPPPAKAPKVSSTAFALTSSGAPAVHPRVHSTTFSSLKHKSHMLVGHPERDTWAQMSCARANLRACGDWTDEDWGKPHITIAAPCVPVLCQCFCTSIHAFVLQIQQRAAVQSPIQHSC